MKKIKTKYHNIIKNIILKIEIKLISKENVKIANYFMLLKKIIIYVHIVILIKLNDQN